MPLKHHLIKKSLIWVLVILTAACSEMQTFANESWTLVELLQKRERIDNVLETIEVRNCGVVESKTVECSAGTSNELNVSLGGSFGRGFSGSIEASVSTGLGIGRDSGESLDLPSPPDGVVYRYTVNKKYRVLIGDVLARSSAGREKTTGYTYHASCSLRIESVTTLTCAEADRPEPTQPPPVEVWATDSKLPRDMIKQRWDEGYHITNLIYGDGIWAAVFSQRTNYTYQVLVTGSEFPKDVIEQKWDEGSRVMDLAYGDSVWAVILSKGTGYTAQEWATRSEFPQDVIKQGWDEGYYITDLAYGNGVWAVVLSQGTGYTSQEWISRSEFPQDVIKQGWDEGYYITDLAYGDGVWAVILSQGPGYTAQAWATRSEFPHDVIRQGRDEGYSITELAYGNGAWAVVISK